MRISGVLVPMTTPFDTTTGEVDPVALRRNARVQLEAGVQGIVAGGSTGEAPLLTEAEASQTVEWLRDVVPSDRYVIVGAGRESTRATIDACRNGADAGADAALVRPPSYYAPAISDNDLERHFSAVADASPIPILLYNIPKYTLPLAPHLLGRLTGHQNILGAKDSSGDIKNFSAYREVAPDWQFLIGSGALLYAALELGGVGGILGVANFAMTHAVDIVTFFGRGDRAGSGAVQEQLAPLHNTIVKTHGPAGVKCAMDLVGLYGGPVRPPLGDVDESGREAIGNLLAHASLIGT